MRENIGKSILDSLISPVWTVTTSLVLVQIPISPLKIQLLIVKQKICVKKTGMIFTMKTQSFVTLKPILKALTRFFTFNKHM